MVIGDPKLLQASSVRPPHEPVYSASTVVKSLPIVSTVSWPASGGVYRNQTPLPGLNPHEGTGSPVEVATSVDSVLVYEVEEMTVALLHRSLGGGEARCRAKLPDAPEYPPARIK